MIPLSFPGRDDVISDVFVAFGRRRLDGIDLQTYVKKAMIAYNRMYPTKFRKFGDARLISLDQLAFEDGVTTIGDQVSRALWD